MERPSRYSRSRARDRCASARRSSRSFMPGAKAVYLPSPTWGNHKNILADSRRASGREYAILRREHRRLWTWPACWKSIDDAHARGVRRDACTGARTTRRAWTRRATEWRYRSRTSMQKKNRVGSVLRRGVPGVRERVARTRTPSAPYGCSRRCGRWSSSARRAYSKNLGLYAERVGAHHRGARTTLAAATNTRRLADEPRWRGRCTATRRCTARGSSATVMNDPVLFQARSITLVPIRPRRRGERRSLRTFPGVSLRPPLGFNPDTPRRLSTPSDAFQLHPDVASYGTTLSGGTTRWARWLAASRRFAGSCSRS